MHAHASRLQSINVCKVHVSGEGEEWRDMHAHASRFSQGCKVYEGKGQNMERVRDVGWRGGEKGWAKKYKEWRGKEEKAKRERERERETYIYIYIASALVGRSFWCQG